MYVQMLHLAFLVLLYGNRGSETRTNDNILATAITMSNKLYLPSASIHEPVAG